MCTLVPNDDRAQRLAKLRCGVLRRAACCADRPNPRPSGPRLVRRVERESVLEYDAVMDRITRVCSWLGRECFVQGAVASVGEGHRATVAKSTSGEYQRRGRRSISAAETQKTEGTERGKYLRREQPEKPRGGRIRERGKEHHSIGSRAGRRCTKAKVTVLGAYSRHHNRLRRFRLTGESAGFFRGGGGFFAGTSGGEALSGGGDGTGTPYASMAGLTASTMACMRAPWPGLNRDMQASSL